MTLKLNGTNSVAAPAYAGDDADTGLQCGTDELKLVTGGTARTTVSSSGVVGINKSSGFTTGGFASPQLSIKQTSADWHGGFHLESASSSKMGVISNTEDGLEISQSYRTTNDGGAYKPIIFRTSANERMRILSSGGITFNGDTAQANALEDYEEGTWTPELKSSSTNPSVTYGTRAGYYTKIGRIVYFHASVQWSARASQGTGLIMLKTPFSISSSVSWQGTFMAPYVSGLSTTAVGTSYADPGQGGFYVRNASTTNSLLNTGNIGTTGHIIYGGFFIPA